MSIRDIVNRRDQLKLDAMAELGRQVLLHGQVCTPGSHRGVPSALRWSAFYDLEVAGRSAVVIDSNGNGDTLGVQLVSVDDAGLVTVLAHGEDDPEGAVLGADDLTLDEAIGILIAVGVDPRAGYQATAAAAVA